MSPISPALATADIKWALERTSAPASEPVTLTDVHNQLRIDFTDDDTLLTTLITVAREAIEEFLSKALITQTWELRLTRFPSFYLPLPRSGALGHVLNLSAVNSVKYFDVNGTQQTLDPSLYLIDSHAQPVARLQPPYGKAWPPVRYAIPDVVIVNYTVGQSSNTTIPQVMRQALLMLVGSLYEQREADLEKQQGASAILERAPIFGELRDAHKSRWEPEFI